MTYSELSPPSGGIVEARPAAAVVVVRDGPLGCETLLVLRNPQLSFHGGSWVFPGGRIDAEDLKSAAAPDDMVSAARVAAIREAKEEAAVDIETRDLVLFSRWITPEGLPKRFDAWYFAAATRSDHVQVDGGEILDHRWMRPADALAAHRAGEMDLPPPTWVTLHHFSAANSAAAALERARLCQFDFFLPRLHWISGGACALYGGDAAYESGELECAGPRHRLWMIGGGWRYERDPR